MKKVRKVYVQKTPSFSVDLQCIIKLYLSLIFCKSSCIFPEKKDFAVSNSN